MTLVFRPPEVRRKHLARSLVDAAIKKGRLVRPTICERCGKEPPPMKDGRVSIQGHHHLGYDHKLAVEWLCVKCHMQETPNACRLKTHCPQGHPYSGENLYVDPGGGRRCIACERASTRRRRQRLREQRNA